jgi:hypothetical protein
MGCTGRSYDDHWRYAHMAMAERVYAPGGGETQTMMVAWQAAPLVDPDLMGNQVMAVEGLKDQRILYSISYDMGKMWTKAQVAPTHTAGFDGGHAEEGKPDFEHAVWSPVLHCDRSTGRMHLFYTESSACWRPTSPPTCDPLTSRNRTFASALYTPSTGCTLTGSLTHQRSSARALDGGARCQVGAWG